VFLHGSAREGMGVLLDFLDWYEYMCKTFVVVTVNKNFLVIVTHYRMHSMKIKMDLREIGWDGVDWIDLAQNRDQWRALVNTVMNLRVR
jgi:hypothetical protein